MRLPNKVITYKESILPKLPASDYEKINNKKCKYQGGNKNGKMGMSSMWLRS